MKIYTLRGIMFMIKVLQVFNAMECGGAESMIMNLYREIDKTKFSFDFLVHTDKDCYFDREINALGGKIYRVPRWNGKNYFVYKKAVSDFFDKHPDYDIVHGHIASSAAIYLNEAKKRNIKIISHSHSTTNEPTLKNFLFNTCTYPVRNIADYFLACSTDAGKSMFGEGIVKNKNFSVLKNPVQTEKFKFDSLIRKWIRENYKVEDKFVIGHVGRFRKEKNHIFLLNIFKEALKYNQNSVLMLVGNGNGQKSVEDEAKKLGIYDKVIFTGVRNDVHNILKAMDVFVFPSKFEGLGNALIEAQASGLKCVVSKNIPKEADCTDLVIRKDIKESPDEWAKEICSVGEINRDEYYKKVSGAGFETKDIAGQLEKVYENIR